jgi:hypothetical protein
MKRRSALNLDDIYDNATVREVGPITFRALGHDWGLIIDDLQDEEDDDLHERADVEAEEARMDPEHLDGPG